MKARKGPRTAVVLVHGIGEQRPMRTIRGFVDGLLGVPDHRLYTIPDSADFSFELLTIIKPANVGDHRKQADFYEGYWAPEAKGTKVSHVTSWARRLLFRRRRSVPARLRTLWLVLWVFLLLTVTILAWERLDPFSWTKSTAWTITAYILALGLPAAGLKVASTLGDAARCFDDRPPNIEMRHTIRKRIVDLLTHLHKENRYDRIILVGHSLGGVVAYDAVRILWQQRVSAHSFSADDRDVVAAAHELLMTPNRTDSRKRFRAAQLELSRVLSDETAGAEKSEPRWLITDLVTVGAPVAYPSLFLSGPKVGLARQIRERSVPTCPPQLSGPNQDTYCFTSLGGHRYIHHGAVFAAVRWTNIYARGDFVGGDVGVTDDLSTGASIRPDCGLGAGVMNHKIDDGWRSRVPLISHTCYWPKDGQAGSSVAALRSVIFAD